MISSKLIETQSNDFQVYSDISSLCTTESSHKRMCWGPMASVDVIRYQFCYGTDRSAGCTTACTLLVTVRPKPVSFIENECGRCRSSLISTWGASQLLASAPVFHTDETNSKSETFQFHCPKLEISLHILKLGSFRTCMSCNQDLFHHPCSHCNSDLLQPFHKNRSHQLRDFLWNVYNHDSCIELLPLPCWSKKWVSITYCFRFETTMLVVSQFICLLFANFSMCLSDKPDACCIGRLQYIKRKEFCSI